MLLVAGGCPDLVLLTVATSGSAVAVAATVPAGVGWGMKVSVATGIGVTTGAEALTLQPAEANSTRQRPQNISVRRIASLPMTALHLPGKDVLPFPVHILYLAGDDGPTAFH